MLVRRWALALDLNRRCEGMLRFVAWLSSRAPQFRWTVVHVTHPDATAQQRAGARQQACDLVAGFSIGQVEDVDVVAASDPLSGLSAWVEEHAPQGIVVGRRPDIGGQPRSRLGHVVRQFLRRAPCPVLVVPTDYDLAVDEASPLVAGLEGDEMADAVLDQLDELAKLLPAPKVAVTARPATVSTLGPSIGTEAPTVDGAVLPGRDPSDYDVVARESSSPGDLVARVASRRNAALILYGNPRRGLLSRSARPSPCSTLAVKADRPVLVIPPARNG